MPLKRGMESVMLKKLVGVTILAVFTFMLFIVPAGAEQRFPDVSEAKLPWAYVEINNMVELGLIKGYPDGTFGPERDVTKMESLILCSRILGFSDERYEPFIEVARGLYKDTLDEYDIQYKDEVAFLIYKNVLKENELDVYIGHDNASLPLKRYEAATLFTKVLGAEEDAKKASMSSPFTDSSDIPAVSKPYVNFVYGIGLMLGMNKTDTVNEFKPLVNINRAQMAVLLYRMMGMLNEEVSFVTLADVDGTKRTLMYVDENGNETGLSLLYEDNPIIKNDGFSVTFDKLRPGSSAAIIRRDGALYAIEAVTIMADEVFKGVVASVYISKTAGKITVTKVSGNEKFEFPLAQNVSVIYEGSPGALTDVKVSDYVELEIKSGEVVLIDAKKKDKTITGTVAEIILSPEFMFVIRHTDGSEVAYPVAETVTAKRNGTTTDFSNILVGDKVSITLRYDRISVINATSTKSTVSGTIEEIKISTLPSIKVKKSSGSVETYSISRDAEYVVDGIAGNIYSLRLNAVVTLNVEGETVVKVTSSTPTTTAAINGKISTINTAYGFFMLDVADPVTGDINSKQVFFKRTSVKIINSADGKEKNVNELATGMNVSVTGAMNMGAFEATTIIILPQ